MKITLYELIGLIINGKAPRQIKYYSYIYEYDEDKEDYECFKIDHYEYIFVNLTYLSDLNNEIEIIEEEKEIEEFKTNYTCSELDFEIIDKINELVRELNKIKKEGK